MLNKVLSVGAGFDWISPLWKLILDYRRRPSVGYSIPADCGWQSYAIQDILCNSGIKLWGLALYQETFVFSVREAQAQYTQYLLEKSGIPYYGGISHIKLTSQSAKTSSTNAVTWTFGLDNLFLQLNKYIDSI